MTKREFPGNVDRGGVLQAKKDYKYQCRKSKLAFQTERSKMMNNLRKISLKNFGNYLKAVLNFKREITFQIMILRYTLKI